MAANDSRSGSVEPRPMHAQANVIKANGKPANSKGPLHSVASPFGQNNLFDGKTYDHKRDESRLSSQLSKVLELMSDGEWRSLASIVCELAAMGCQATEASVSSRLRDLRKVKFGAHTVNRTYRGYGLFVYQVVRRVG